MQNKENKDSIYEIRVSIKAPSLWLAKQALFTIEGVIALSEIKEEREGKE